nr:AI-2E family transporter [Paracoccus onubensis]
MSDRPESSFPQRGHLRPLVTDQSIARWLLVVVIVASVYFFHGFLIPMLAAGIMAVASWSIRSHFTDELGLPRNLAAALLILLVLALLVVPISLALIYAAQELRIWIIWAIEINGTGAGTPGWIASIPGIGSWLDEQWLDYIGRPGAIGELVQTVSGSNIANLYRGVLSAGSMAFHLALNVVFTLIALFVFYRNGDMIVEQLDRVGVRILPGRWEHLSRMVPATISSTVTGMTLIAISEGVVLGIAYWLAGVPSPIVFGVITGFMALIPGGAPLSFTLISIYLAFSGSVYEGAALFIWGTVELFIVDKTIRPALVGGPVKLPFLATFFGLIGGVKTMGLVGLFVGPVLMALLVAIWREWQREILARK